MNPQNPKKPDGAQQKSGLVSAVTQSVLTNAGSSVGGALSLELASVAAAAYHYSLGVYRSSEIATRIAIDPAFAPWRRNGNPSAEDIARARTEDPALLRSCIIDVLGWTWNVSLRHQVTGENTIDYAERVVAGRPQQFKSLAHVEEEADQRINTARQMDEQ